MKPGVGQRWADKRAPGRVVQVLSIDRGLVLIETVEPADTASTERAVGRQSMLDQGRLERSFVYLDDGT